MENEIDSELARINMLETQGLIESIDPNWNGARLLAKAYRKAEDAYWIAIHRAEKAEAERDALREASGDYPFHKTAVKRLYRRSLPGWGLR